MDYTVHDGVAPMAPDCERCRLALLDQTERDQLDALLAKSGQGVDLITASG